MPPVVPAIGVTLLGLLMVSPIPYHSGKNLRFGQSYSGTVIPVIVSLFLILEPGLNFFLVGLLYVLSGPVGYVWRARTGRELLPVMPLEEEDEPEAMTDDEGNVTSLSGHLPTDRGDRGGEERR